MNGQCGPVSKWPCGEPPYNPSAWTSTVMSHNCYAYMLNDLKNTHRLTGKSQPGWAYKALKNNRSYNGIHILNCKETIRGVMKDNPDNMKAYTLSYGSKMSPPKYHYKGFLMVGPNEDFHFARQDNRMLRVYNSMSRDGKHLQPNSAVFLKELLRRSERILPEICQYMPKRCRTLKSKLRFIYKNSKTWSHKPGSTPVSDVDADGKLIFDPLLANWDYSNRGGVNYSKKCCFFTIPMNTHKPTFSSGIGTSNADISNNKTRSDVSTTDHQQRLDARVRKLLNV